MALVPQKILFKRRIPGTGAPAAGVLEAGEPAVAITAAGVADMWVGDGTDSRVLVSETRQVELAGTQTITGAKTIGAAGSFTSPVANIHISGGTAGQLLTTDGATPAVLSWINPPAAGIPAHSATATYAIGDFVSQGGHIWRATAANGPAAWNPANWDRVAQLSDIPDISVGPTNPATGEPGDLFYNTTNNQLFAWNGTAWVLANRVTVAAAAPTPAATGMAWLNSTTNVLSIYNGTAWLSSTGNRSHLGATAPAGTNHQTGDIWWSPAGPQTWSGTAWVAMDIGATGIEDLEIEAPLHGDGLTAGTALGVTPATHALVGDQVQVGTNNVFPVTPAGLTSIVQGTAINPPMLSALTTTVKTGIVPAINELVTRTAALTGALRFVGNYDADQSEVTTAVAGTLTTGQNLPTASAANEGWYVIVTTDGTPTAPAPNVPMHTGDWIVSTGTGGWIHVPLYHAAISAANVGVAAFTPAQATWTNVQLALQGLLTRMETAGGVAVITDQTSVLGDGTSAAETNAAGRLRVGTVNGGTY